MPPLNVRDLGDFIRDQRKAAQISVRQLARQAGVSNPYLSQIERGLRKPSAEILQQIAKALRISAEVLYVQAGILDERSADSDVTAAVLADPALTERQKQVIVEIYDAFRKENAVYGLTVETSLPDDPGLNTPASGPAPGSPSGSDPDPGGDLDHDSDSDRPRTTVGEDPPGDAVRTTDPAVTSPTTGTGAKSTATARRTAAAARAATTPSPRTPGSSGATSRRTPASRRPRATATTGEAGKTGGDLVTKAGRASPGRATRAAAVTDEAAIHDPTGDASKSTK